MIKRPDAVAEIIKKFDRTGYDVICAGECVIGAMMGDSPLDWDMYTECSTSKVMEMFPEGELIGKRTVRLDHTSFVESTNVNEADHFDGVVADIITLDGPLDKQLEIYDFTCEATGEHSNGSAADPLGGRNDIKQKLLKSVGDFKTKVKKDPTIMWKALRYVGIYGFDLSREVFDTIQANRERAIIIDKEIILDEFMTAMVGNHAGKFLKMLKGLNLLEAIVGQGGTSAMPREKKDFKDLCENIDKTKKIINRRLGLFYLVFDKNYKKALHYLPHDEEVLDYLEDAKRLCPKLYFCKNEEMIKNFIAKFGWKKYHFYDRLLKAQNIVYELNNQQQLARDEILKVIIREKQPIFMSDLLIDADDIIEAGITEDKERAEYLMELLLSPVHKDRRNNDRDKLLKLARGFNKSRLKRTFKDVNWLR